MWQNRSDDSAREDKWKTIYFCRAGTWIILENSVDARSILSTAQFAIIFTLFLAL